MEEKQVVVSPRCPTHGWVDELGTRPTSTRHQCVSLIEYSRDGHYIIRESNFEAAGLNA